MRSIKLFISVFILIASLSCKGQSNDSRIKIVHPTIDLEATSVWRTINDYAFFEQKGYNINLPNDPMIDSLIEKSKSGTFGNDDYPSIYSLLESKFFEKSSYQKAIQNVANQKELINKMIAVLADKKDDWDWKFNMFNEYKVVFTLYGTGGSYDPDNGTITLLTNKSGGFMNYKNPANTIIHEITHMGMEYSLVRKYNLPHGLKERLVDTLVYLMFKEDLPEYRIQQMGNPKINDDLKSANDLGSLNSIVSKFVNK